MPSDQIPFYPNHSTVESNPTYLLARLPELIARPLFPDNVLLCHFISIEYFLLTFQLTLNSIIKP